MRRLAGWLVVFAALVASFALWARREPSEAPRASAPVASEPDGPSKSPPAELASTTAAAESAEERVESRDLDERQVASLDAPCRLFGVVVDDLDRPVADVVVSLHERDGGSKLETRTSASGDYELVAPFPTGGACEIEFTTADGFCAATRRFRPHGSDGTLHVGDNDLGRTVLKRAGAIEGRVTLRDGTPVPFMEVQASRRTREERLVLTARSAADGSYRIAPVPPGDYRLAPRGGRFGIVVPGSAREVELDAAATLADADLVLSCASFIAGRVVDSESAPRAQVDVVVFLPEERIAAVVSDAEGRFCVPLEAHAPHRLLACWPKSPIDRTSREGTLFAPGEREARLVLADRPMARFTVVDAKTRRPIERFGVRLVHGDSVAGRFESGVIAAFRLADHPDGLAELALGPRDNGYQVIAPGHVAQEAALPTPSSTHERILVELARGAVVTGRVTLGGKPTFLGSARLSPTAIGKRAVASQSGELVDEDVFDVAGITGYLRALDLELDGSFRFDDLAPGTYDLEVRRRGGSRARFDALRVAAGAVVDVGEVALEPAATLRGRALLPPGVDARLVRVQVASQGRAYAAKLAADATFAIDDVPAGPCSVTVPASDGAVVKGEAFAFELAAGETRDVLLDLRDRAGAWITLRVSACGRPLAQARLISAWPKGMHWPTTNQHGESRSWRAPATRVGVDVITRAGASLGHHECDVRIGADGEGHVELEIEAAGVVIDWRGVVVAGPIEGVNLAIDPSEARDGDTLRIWADDHGEWGVAALEQSRCDLGCLAPGPHTLRLSVYRSLGESAGRFERKVLARAGEAIECAFTEADRIE